MENNKLFLSSYIMGGLGNQMFQIFTTIATSFRQNKNFIFPFYDLSPGITKRVTYWDTLFDKLLNYTTFNNNIITNKDIKQFFVFREISHNYKDILNYNVNTILFGYFQSFKYFDNYKNEILKLIDFDNKKNTINSKYNYFQEEDNSITISIHFRFGDYLKLKDVFEILDEQYYIRAIKEILYRDLTKNVNLFYFYELADISRVDTIIEKIQDFTGKYTEFNFKHIKINNNIPDWEQMILMSCCNHNIIANSTFSWWGAYLNNNKYSFVCYPNKWFGSKEQKKQNEMNDMFPKDWICL